MENESRTVMFYLLKVGERHVLLTGIKVDSSLFDVQLQFLKRDLHTT